MGQLTTAELREIDSNLIKISQTTEMFEGMPWVAFGFPLKNCHIPNMRGRAVELTFQEAETPTFSFMRAIGPILERGRGKEDIESRYKLLLISLAGKEIPTILYVAVGEKQKHSSCDSVDHMYLTDSIGMEVLKSGKRYNQFPVWANANYNFAQIEPSIRSVHVNNGGLADLIERIGGK